MKGTRAAHRYAKAILAYAQENNSAAAVAQDMLLVTDLLNKSEELKTALVNPLLGADKKRDVVHALYLKRVIQPINCLDYWQRTIDWLCWEE